MFCDEGIGTKWVISVAINLQENMFQINSFFPSAPLFYLLKTSEDLTAF